MGPIAMLLLALGGAPGSAGAPDPSGLILERVVLLQRHGVRAPTQSAETLKRLADRPWPVWPVAPGELTPHGMRDVELMGAGLSRALADQGLLPAAGCPAPGSVKIIADGQDQRTRASGAALARSLATGCGLAVLASPPGAPDPLFDASGICPIDADAALAAVRRTSGSEGLPETPLTRAALTALKAAMGEVPCDGSGGPCMDGPSDIVATANGVKVKGPLADGAVLAEVFLLEYAEGMPGSDVAWGAGAAPTFLKTVMAAHERSAELLRRTPYLAERRGALMARAMLGALSAPASTRTDAAVTLFVGHDTNLSNMAGIFGLEWTLPGEPDPTGPSVTLALELWRDPATGARRVRPAIYYQSLEDLRHLTSSPVRRVDLKFQDCPSMQGCPLAQLAAGLESRLAKDCPAALAEADHTSRGPVGAGLAGVGAETRK